MVKFLSRIVLFGILLIGDTRVYAQPAERKSPGVRQLKSLHFSGHINGKIEPTDSITLSVFKDFYFQFTGKEVYVAPINSDGTFEITVPGIERMVEVYFSLYGSQDRYLRDYIAEPGDDIYMDIILREDDFKLTFSGRGSQKYNCVRALELKRNSFHDARSFLLNNTHSRGSLDTMYRLFKKFQEEQLQIIQMFRKNLNSDVREFMEAEFLAYIPAIWQMEMFDFAQKATTSDQLENIRNIYPKLGNYNAQAASRFEARSRNYIEYLLIREKVRLYFEGGFKKANWQQGYNRIRGSFSGVLREKLIANYLLDFNLRKLLMEEPENFLGCVDDALSLIRDDKTRQLFFDQIYALKKGNKAREFSLIDTAGKKVSLGDFKGKAVLMDIWYTGCSSCMHFSRKFEDSIYPQVKMDSLFKVVNICIDFKRQTWIKNIKSYRYTSPEFVNLYTEGLGDEHPLLKDYKVLGFPFVLLIGKDGNIFSQIQPEASSDVIISTIKAAINEQLPAMDH